MNTSVFDFVTASTYEVVLVRPDIAYDSNGNIGFWTMVYDEGFEVRIDGRVFFAFMAYYPKVGVDPLASEDISVCAQTRINSPIAVTNIHTCMHVICTNRITYPIVRQRAQAGIITAMVVAGVVTAV